MDDRVGADETCEQIQWLTAHHLRKVATSKQWGDCETLFQDPDDGRFGNEPTFEAKWKAAGHRG